jgi:hypothetical protein
MVPMFSPPPPSTPGKADLCITLSTNSTTALVWEQKWREVGQGEIRGTKTRSRVARTNEKCGRLDFVSGSEACARDVLGQVSQVRGSEWQISAVDWRYLPHTGLRKTKENHRLTKYVKKRQEMWFQKNHGEMYLVSSASSSVEELGPGLLPVSHYTKNLSVVFPGLVLSPLGEHYKIQKSFYWWRIMTLWTNG